MVHGPLYGDEPAPGYSPPYTQPPARERRSMTVADAKASLERRQTGQNNIPPQTAASLYHVSASGSHYAYDPMGSKGEEFGAGGPGVDQPGWHTRPLPADTRVFEERFSNELEVGSTSLRNICWH
jgi:hypothetical protein